MTIFDILTESLFDVSLRNCDNGVSGFDYAEFLQSQDAAMREAVKRVSDMWSQADSLDVKQWVHFIFMYHL